MWLPPPGKTCFFGAVTAGAAPAGGFGAGDAPDEFRHPTGMVLIHADDEPSRIGLLLFANARQLGMRVCHHRP